MAAMREMLENLSPSGDANPMEAAQRNMRPPLRGRFYREAAVGAPETGGFPVLLDGRPVRSPGRNVLAAPSRSLAEALAAEWDAQETQIDPARMPLTRLANTIIDGVASARDAIRDEIAKYLASDLLFYRAAEPARLVALQAEHWDPILDWAHGALGARFILAEGVTFVAQPERALAAAEKAIPSDPWRLGALLSATTLTGSALLALAVAHGRLPAESAWEAANVDEDWNLAQWGRDELATQRRDFRWQEMQAAAKVLDELRAANSDQGSPVRG